MLTILLASIFRVCSAFWISAEIESIEWSEQQCLTTTICSQPRFQLVKELAPISERVAINWPISDQFLTTRHPSPFTTFWPSGRLEDLSVSLQVMGIDNTYGFPRTCDQTPAVRVFPDDLGHDSPHNRTLLIKAKCFDATIVVRRFAEQCPWCLERKIDSGRKPVSNAWNRNSVVIYTLASFAALTTSGFSVMLVIFVRSRRSPRHEVRIDTKPKLISPIAYDTRYDLPWEQKLSFPTPPSPAQLSPPI